MQREVLNLGILAHVDAGKTSLTERLLFDNGATSELGSVDAGTTRTDSGELERERGITIRSAVAPFITGARQVNIVDTPGHPDFIAEVERALTVLDGAVLVLSAVEGVQSQTRVLMKSLRLMHLPTLLFVNKIDRMGARTDDLLADIRRKLVSDIVPMSVVHDAGSLHAGTSPASFVEDGQRMRLAEALAEHDQAVLGQLVDGNLPPIEELNTVLAKQIANADIFPVFFGSALTGEGVHALTEGIRTLLPAANAETSNGELRGTVFAIERANGKEKVAYLRLFLGELRERQRVTFHRFTENGNVSEFTGKVAGLEIIGERLSSPGIEGINTRTEASHDQLRTNRRLTSGNIGKIRGLPQIRVGDYLGHWDLATVQPNFSPPTLTAVVRSRISGQEASLHSALTSIADEDPLIQTRIVGNGAMSVLVYGAVQKEVIAERLQREFGVEPVFEDIRPVYFERPINTGEAVREFNPRDPDEYFWATIGLRVEPSENDSGVIFRRKVKAGLMPQAYYRAIEESALQTLQQGLYGWPVTDCNVTLTHLGFEAPMVTAATFRNLTWIVVLRALQLAGTRVYEPYQSLEVEIPSDVANNVINYLAALGGDIIQTLDKGQWWQISVELPVRLAQEFTAALPRLSHGEGALWTRPSTDRPVLGTFPVQERFDDNRFTFDEYLKSGSFFQTSAG